MKASAVVCCLLVLVPWLCVGLRSDSDIIQNYTELVNDGEFCLCSYDLFMDYSKAVELHPDKFGAPEIARTMKGMRMSSQDLRVAIEKESCGGKCSLDKCQGPVLLSSYVEALKQNVGEADVEAGIVEARRSFTNKNMMLNGLAKDCATYTRSQAQCLCFSQSDSTNGASVECPYYSKKGALASLTRTGSPLPPETGRCVVADCNHVHARTGTDVFFSCIEVS